MSSFSEIKEKLEAIKMLAGSMPVAENNELGIMFSCFCTSCSKRAMYIYQGNSLCDACYMSIIIPKEDVKKKS